MESGNCHGGYSLVLPMMGYILLSSGKVVTCFERTLGLTWPLSGCSTSNSASKQSFLAAGSTSCPKWARAAIVAAAHPPPALAAAPRSGLSFTRMIIPNRALEPAGAARRDYYGTTFPYYTQCLCCPHLQWTYVKALVIGPMVMGKTLPPGHSHYSAPMFRPRNPCRYCKGLGLEGGHQPKGPWKMQKP